MNFGGRQPSVEDNLGWKTIFDGSHFNKFLQMQSAIKAFILAKRLVLQSVGFRWHWTGNDNGGPIFWHERSAFQSVAVQSVNWHLFS